MNLQIVGEIGALGEQNKVRKREGSRHNLTTLLLRDGQLGSRIAHSHCLRGKRTLATERQRVAHILDIHRLCGQERHITADLLEIQRGHRNTRSKLSLRHLDIRIIAIQKVELVTNTALLLPVLQRDHQVIALRLGYAERDCIIVRHRLHNLIEVIGVQTHIQFGSRMVILIMLELGRIQTHMSENCAGIVHRNHADTILIKNKTHLH